MIGAGSEKSKFKVGRIAQGPGIANRIWTPRKLGGAEILAEQLVGGGKTRRRAGDNADFFGLGLGALGGSGQEWGRRHLLLTPRSPRQHVGQVGDAGNFGLTVTTGRDETTFQTTTAC